MLLNFRSALNFDMNLDKSSLQQVYFKTILHLQLEMYPLQRRQSLGFSFDSGSAGMWLVTFSVSERWFWLVYLRSCRHFFFHRGSAQHETFILSLKLYSRWHVCKRIYKRMFIWTRVYSPTHVFGDICMLWKSLIRSRVMLYTCLTAVFISEITILKLALVSWKHSQVIMSKVLA